MPGAACVAKTAGTIRSRRSLATNRVQVGALGAQVLRAFPSQQAPQSRMGAASLMRERLRQAKEVCQAEIMVNSRRDPLQDVVNRVKPLFVFAQRQDDICTALRLGDELAIDLVLVGGYEAPGIIGELKKRDVSVIWVPVLSADAKDSGLAGAAALLRGGIELTLASAYPRQRPRELMKQAQQLALQGLPTRELLRAMTITPARIYGIDHRVGSIEVGKDADIVVFDGNPLQGAPIKAVFVDGVRRY